MAVCLHTVLMLQHNSEDQWVYSGQLLLSSETKVFAVEFNKVERRQSLWLSLLTEASEKYHQILFWKYWIVTSDGCWWSDDNNMCSTGATCQLCSLVSATEALGLLVSRPELGSCLDTLCVWWPSSALFSTAGSHSTHGKLPPKLLSHTTDQNWPALSHHVWPSTSTKKHCDETIIFPGHCFLQYPDVKLTTAFKARCGWFVGGVLLYYFVVQLSKLKVL